MFQVKVVDMIQKISKVLKVKKWVQPVRATR